MDYQPITNYELHNKNGYIRYKKQNIHFFSDITYDVSDGNCVKSYSPKYLMYEGVIKKFSRKKRKMIKNGDYIPLDICSPTTEDAIGNSYEERLLAKLTYPISYHEIPKQQVIHNTTIDEQTIFPLYKKSRKYKTPCSSSLSYIKQYLTYVKHMDTHEFMKTVSMKLFPDYEVKTYVKYNFVWNPDITHSIVKSLYILFINMCKETICPILYVKCPCYLMGEKKCNKMINVMQLIDIVMLSDEPIIVSEFTKWLYKEFVIPVIQRKIEINNGPIQYTYKRVSPNKTTVRFLELTSCLVECCMQHKLIIRYKNSETTIKKRGVKKCHMFYCNCSMDVLLYTRLRVCSCCGNYASKHKKRTKCPAKICVEDITEEETKAITQALLDDNIESATCPNCSMICTKDENCDKVRCGAIDGGHTNGCGTSFCFRCGEDITCLGTNYLNHLHVVVKPDGTNTHWVCKKFSKECPQCNIKQYWDGESDTIHCGVCNSPFSL